MIEHHKHLTFQVHLVTKWIRYGFRPIIHNIPEMLKKAFERQA